MYNDAPVVGPGHGVGPQPLRLADLLLFDHFCEIFKISITVLFYYSLLLLLAIGHICECFHHLTLQTQRAQKDPQISNLGPTKLHVQTLTLF